jgi:hypothetical protein
MAGSEEHLEPHRIVDLSRNSTLELTGAEKTHLDECEECQRVLAVLVRHFSKQIPAHDNGHAAA